MRKLAQGVVRTYAATRVQRESLVLLTCHVINRIEAYSKTAHFQRVVLLTALHKSLQVFPVAFLEQSIVLRVQSRALELSEAGLVERVFSIEVWARIKKEGDLTSFCVICILNDFLNWKMIHVYNGIQL